MLLSRLRAAHAKVRQFLESNEVRAPRPPPRPRPRSRSQSRRAMEVARRPRLVPRRNHLYRRDLPEHRQNDLCQGRSPPRSFPPLQLQPRRQHPPRHRLPRRRQTRRRGLEGSPSRRRLPQHVQIPTLIHHGSEPRCSTHQSTFFLPAEPPLCPTNHSRTRALFFGARLPSCRNRLPCFIGRGISRGTCAKLRPDSPRVTEPGLILQPAE